MYAMLEGEDGGKRKALKCVLCVWGDLSFYKDKILLKLDFIRKYTNRLREISGA